MIEKLYKIWENSPKDKKIMVLTGSGISIASGIDIHQKRNKQEVSEFWGEKSKILTKYNLINDTSKMLNWVAQKRQQLVQINPNASHYALLKLEHYFKEKFYLITENIDNLHAHAGNNRLIELNGNIFNDINLSPIELEQISQPLLLHKNSQGQFIRPDIVLSGEKINKKKYLQAHLFAQQCDICIVVGSFIDNSPFHELPLISKKFKNAQIVEINHKKSFIEDSDIYIKCPSENILPMLVNMMIELDEWFKISTK